MSKFNKRSLLTKVGVIATALTVAAGVATPAQAVSYTHLTLPTT